MTSPPDTIALIHGFASNFDHSWRQTGWVDILWDFGCAAPEIDLPGHGSSDRFSEPEDYADVEEQLLAALPPHYPVSAVGFSVGADLLLRLALTDPRRFDRIALLGLGDGVFESTDPGPIVDALAAAAEPEDVRARVFRRLALSTGNDSQALSAFLRRPRRALTEDELSTLDLPVLVVLGDQDMTKSAERLVNALPEASLVTLAGVDHFATPSDFGAIDATMRFFGFE